MTALRQQFIESLQSQGISMHTQEEYVRAVSRLAQFYHRSPERITDQEILNFLKHLKQNNGLSDGSIRSALCGLKALYTNVLNRNWQVHWKTPAGLKNCPPPKPASKFPGTSTLQQA